jgi:hypothetical protein
MYNNSTNYQIKAQEKRGNLTNDKIEKINNLMKLKQYRIGKQFTENTDKTYKAPGNDFDIITEHYQNVERPQQLAKEADEIQDEEGMVPVREMWDHIRTANQDRLNKSMRKEKEKKAKTFSDVLHLARKNQTVLEGIKSLTTKKGGKSRVFRKKSNKTKTKTKKVSRRNRRSRNSRAHKRK